MLFVEVSGSKFQVSSEMGCTSVIKTLFLWNFEGKYVPLQMEKKIMAIKHGK